MNIEKLDECPSCGSVEYWWYDGQICEICSLQKSGTSVGAQKERAGLVPNGWKLVPVEPTEAMVHAWANAAPEDYDRSGLSDDEVNRIHATANYSAMLAVAPTAPPGEVERDAGRYRWLRDNGGTLDSVFSGKIREREIWIDKADLDAAIDKAMKESKAP